MAAGAVRLECRELPVNDFCIALMTVSTGQRIAVIKWFVRKSGVAVVCWRPGIRVVAQTAVLCRIEVPRILACCKRTVVA